MTCSLRFELEHGLFLWESHAGSQVDISHRQTTRNAEFSRKRSCLRDLDSPLAILFFVHPLLSQVLVTCCIGSM